MAEIRETELPGVGVRYEFTTDAGRRVGVVAHRTGRREVFVADLDDPDAVIQSVELSADDARTLGDLLGVPQVARELMELQQQVEGLAIDWLPLDEDSPFAGGTIGDTQIRTRTGVSVVAIIRGEEAIPAPGPETRLEGADYLVVVGRPRGVEEVVRLLHDG